MSSEPNALNTNPQVPQTQTVEQRSPKHLRTTNPELRLQIHHTHPWRQTHSKNSETLHTEWRTWNILHSKQQKINRSHTKNINFKTSDSILGIQNLRLFRDLTAWTKNPKYPTSKLHIFQTLDTDYKHFKLKTQDTDHQCIQRPHTSNKTLNTSDSNIEALISENSYQPCLSFSVLWCFDIWGSLADPGRTAPPRVSQVLEIVNN